MQTIRILVFSASGRRAEVMSGFEMPLKGLQDHLRSHIQSQRAPADPEEKKTRTLPGRLDQCHTALAGNIPCIPKSVLKVTPSLLTSFSPSQYKTLCAAKQKQGFSKLPVWDPLCCPEGMGMMLRRSWLTAIHPMLSGYSILVSGDPFPFGFTHFTVLLINN